MRRRKLIARDPSESRDTFRRLFALAELLPAEVLSPPSGAPAVGMLVAVFVAVLFWNVGT